MRASLAVRSLCWALSAIALLVGLFLWSGPAEFSGAEVGDSVECSGDRCRVIDVDESLFVDEVEFSDLPRTVLFEGTEAEVSAWSEERHIEATRPIAIAWITGAVVLLLLGLNLGRISATRVTAGN